MFKSEKQNIHHSKMPKLGELVTLPFDKSRGIVESFPLCDNVLPYSKGVHTCNVRILKNNEVVKVSGFYLVDSNN